MAGLTLRGAYAMIYGHHTRVELIRECNKLAAVNAELLAAAKMAVEAIGNTDDSDHQECFDALQVAIAHAEEQAP